MGDRTLYPHNQQAFDEVMRILESTDKVAIVQATGSGKGVLASEFINKPFKDKNILVLAPTRDILINYKKSLGVNSSNVLFMSYASLSSRFQKFKSGEDLEFERLSTRIDLLIVDEFHRVGAEKWGEATVELIDALGRCGGKTIGLSATPVRYLDNSRDMADEVFNGYVVQGVTLEEAIIQGILPSFKYIVSLYGYRDDIHRLERQYKRIKESSKYSDSEGLSKAEEIIKRLKLQEDEDYVLKETIQKEIRHLPTPQKWIVFCSNIEELREINEHLSIWFDRPLNIFNGGDDWIPREDSLNIFTVHSGSGVSSIENKENLEEFYTVNQGISVITCVNKLNEGNHVDGITGVIMLRRTISPIIYLQQMGRALSAGNKNTPIIFDFINNYNNIKKVQAEDDGLKSIQAIAHNINTYLSDPSTKENSNIRKIVLKNAAKPIVELFNILEDLIVPNTRWSGNELAVLDKYYPMRGIDEVQRRLPKRTEEAIKSMAQQRGLVYNPRKQEVIENIDNSLEWREDENSLILRYFNFFEKGTKSMPECASDLKMSYLQHRTLQQIIDQYEKLTGRQKYKTKKTERFKNDGLRWTDFDLSYLRDAYSNGIPPEAISLVLDRSESAVVAKIRAEGLNKSTKTSKPWSHKEVMYLIANYTKITVPELGKILGRTESAIYHKISRVNQVIEHRKRAEKFLASTKNCRDTWTIVEINLLEEFMDEGLEKLCFILPQRTKQEIQQKVRQLCLEWGCKNPLVA